MLKHPCQGWSWLFLLGLTSSLLAADTPPAAPVPAVVMPPAAPLQVYQRTTLPVSHPYQKALRDYLSTLVAKDFEHGVTEKFGTPPFDGDIEQQYRHHLLSLMGQPLIGTKRGAPAVNAPARLFTLSEIETPAGVMRPPLFPEPVAFLVRWNYAGNPYYQSRAMKLRAFVFLSIQMTMLDDQIEHAPEVNGASRPDWISPTLIMLAYSFPAVRDVLPEPVQEAYRVGLRKLAQRVLDWGPLGEEPNLEVCSPLALWYVSETLKDPAFSKATEAYARRFFTDPQFVHPAGYFVDRGGIDLGYAGQTNFFATWLALASKWPFAIDFVERSHRLRAHVILPEPDGKTQVGPSHFQTRYSADASRDQWEWGSYRNAAAALVTDEAVHLTKLPAPAEMAGAAQRRASVFQAQINENAYKPMGAGMLRNDEITSHPWQFRMFQSYNFPAMVNYGFDHYPVGAYAHRAELEQKNSPLLKSPFLRDETFVRDFGQAFTVARLKPYAAIVHSGAVAEPQLAAGRTMFPGFYGFGGGQLSAFWTPATGSVLLGRRGGLTREKSFDNLEEWRQWPIHAVSGVRANGKIFTSARILKPDVTSNVQPDRGVVRVSGQIPRGLDGQPKALDGRVDYARTFTIEPDALTVETTIKTSQQDTFVEMVETLPVFLRDAQSQASVQPTTIEFRQEGKWEPASASWSNKVTAVRLSRFTGAVVVEFDRARRLKLSPQDWNDTYLSRAACRNVLIDLIENNDQPTVLANASVRYRIQPEN
ncbi:hypothetical protein ETAA8_32100 [Anatilimnocola aggregata]|uniref:Uncharacterized protein n=1 Tax=Anatilimnocola aggregata TaxID=2528021 RepID=A0A517YCZ6_9BACT|nr:hypothetical protein [Anatilimnocola aggregata]QDU28117.1 hypothetical protein ETAA8_32100 [Anatilimnocola aggregata]